MDKNMYTILIVDDNSNNLKVLAGVLKIAGYDFRMAKSGQQALNILEKTTLVIHPMTLLKWSRVNLIF